MKYKNLKNEALKIVNARKQQIMIKDSRFINLDFGSFKESNT